MTEESPIVLAEISVEPTVEGPERGEIIDEAIAALSTGQLRVEKGPASSVVHGSLEDVLAGVRAAHETARSRAERVITQIRLESTHEGSDFEHRLG